MVETGVKCHCLALGSTALEHYPCTSLLSEQQGELMDTKGNWNIQLEGFLSVFSEVMKPGLPEVQ